jgi:transposase
VPQCQIIYDKFHVLQHASAAVEEVRRAEFFLQGRARPGDSEGEAVAVAEPLGSSGPEEEATTESAVRSQPKAPESVFAERELGTPVELHLRRTMLRYLQGWIDPLRWQRLKPMQKLAKMLLDHLEGILNYCRTKIPMGVVEAVNGNIKSLLRRGRGYRDLNYLLLKAQRLAFTKTEFVAFQKAA